MLDVGEEDYEEEEGIHASILVQVDSIRSINN